MKAKQVSARGKAHAKFKKVNGNKCKYCGCTNELILTIDHITPLSREGKDDNKNKQVCCFICNNLKGSLKDQEYKIYLKNLIALKKLCKIQVITKPIVLNFKPAHYPDYKGNEQPK